MIKDLMQQFSTIEGLYASIQDACDNHLIAKDVEIPENLKRLFAYLSRETCEEIKRTIDLTFKIKGGHLSSEETEQARKGFETIINLLNDYGWLFVKTNTITMNKASINSLVGFSGLFAQ